MSAKVVNIYFNGDFRSIAIYEYHVHPNGTTDLIFNKNTNDGIRFETLIMLVKSGLFNDKLIMIFNENITHELAIMLKGLLSSVSNDVRLTMTRYVDHPAEVLKYHDEKAQPIDISDMQSFVNSAMLMVNIQRSLSNNVSPSNFDTLIEIIKTKKLAMPNFAKVDRYAIKRQINWVRSILGKDLRELPEPEALSIINKLKTLDLDSLKKRS
jgi:hypothetical protein